MSDLVQFLLDLESGADDAALHVQSLADKLQAAFSEADFAIALQGITDPLAQLVIKAKAAAQAIPELAQAIAGLDLSTAEGRKEAESRLVALGLGTSDAALRDAILRLLDAIRSVPTPPPSESTGGTTGPTDRTSDPISRSGVVGLTERTGNRLVDLTEAGVRQRSAILDVLRSLAGFSPIRAPQLAAGFGAGGRTGGIFIDARVTTGPISGGDAPAIARQIATQQADALRPIINKLLGEELLAFRRTLGGVS